MGKLKDLLIDKINKRKSPYDVMNDFLDSEIELNKIYLKKLILIK